MDPANEDVEMPQSPRYQIHSRTSWFTQRAARSYLDLYRSLCQNRSRLRRSLCRSILDWDSFQVEAEEVDFELREYTGEAPTMTQDGLSYSFPLSSWVYHYKLRQMEWIVLLGFELEIFLPHEFPGMYWYLQHYVRTRIGHIERMLLFVRVGPTPEQKQRALEQQTLSLLNLYLLEASAMQDLAGAMGNVCAP